MRRWWRRAWRAELWRSMCSSFGSTHAHCPRLRLPFLHDPKLLGPLHPLSCFSPSFCPPAPSSTPSPEGVEREELEEPGAPTDGGALEAGAGEVQGEGPGTAEEPWEAWCWTVGGPGRCW